MLGVQIAKQAKLENQLIPLIRQCDNAVKERDAGKSLLACVGLQQYLERLDSRPASLADHQLCSTHDLK